MLAGIYKVIFTHTAPLLRIDTITDAAGPAAVTAVVRLLAGIYKVIFTHTAPLLRIDTITDAAGPG